MTDRDSLDTNFLLFVVVAFVFLLALAFAIFPRHEAGATVAPSMNAPSPSADTPKKK